MNFSQKREDIDKLEKIHSNIGGMFENSYKKLDLHVTINGGLSIDELRKSINFHHFTNDSLLYIIKQINSNRCTYHDIGPFIEKDSGWYNIREKNIDVITMLTEENMRLKKELEEMIIERNKFKQHCEYFEKEMNALGEHLTQEYDC